MAQQPPSGHVNMLASHIWSPEKSSPGMGPSDPLAAVSGDKQGTGPDATDLASRMMIPDGKKPGQENLVRVWMWCGCGVDVHVCQSAHISAGSGSGSGNRAGQSFGYCVVCVLTIIECMHIQVRLRVTMYASFQTYANLRHAYCIWRRRLVRPRPVSIWALLVVHVSRRQMTPKVVATYTLLAPASRYPHLNPL